MINVKAIERDQLKRQQVSKKAFFAIRSYKNLKRLTKIECPFL